MKLPQANVFGRMGESFGRGFAEQYPKELDRVRLSKGLNDLAQRQDLSPFQTFAQLVSQPGVTPQIVETGGKLLREQGMTQGFRNLSNSVSPQNNPLRKEVTEGVKKGIEQTSGLKDKTNGLVTPENTQAALQNYIPRKMPELQARAADLMDENPKLYPTVDHAMQGAILEDQQEQAANKAKEANRQSQIGVEDRLRGQLQDLRGKANVQIPDNVFQQVENDMIDKVSKGMPELEAAKEGQKKLDQISREYNGLNDLGKWIFPAKSPSDARRSITSLREDFKKRNDLENFADSLVGTNQLSYPKAYYLAYPVKDQKDLNSYIKDLPNIATQDKTHPIYYSKDLEDRTKGIAPKLAQYMGKEGSPLSIGEEIRQKGYDPDTWLQYLTEHQRDLDLTERQARELQKPKNWFPSLNDLWMFIGAGLSKAVED